MRKTLFRPSIHGWPFGNSYDLSILVDEFHLENVGFCGGMCWLALERFYAGTRVPRDLGLPKKGQALYEELKNEQFDSLDVGKVLRMLKWQSSPRMTNGTSILDSLGKRTQSEWPDVKKRIDGGRPVTITLITNANEPNPLKLIENHRVVVYGYDIRDVPDGEGIRGDWNSNIKHVTLNVYDPNYPNNDEVNITFYTGCDDDWIKIRHNRGDSVAGFFLDDVDRKYSYGDESDLQITKCAPLGISSFSEARCRISFSWTCKVIPFFRVLIDGSAWKMNSQLKGGLAPFGKEFKQCDSRSGSMTIDVTVPRAECVLSVQLLDGDFARTRSVHLDMRPQALCRPYIRSRASSETMSIAEKNHRDSDLFVKDPSPDSAAIASMDDGPMRWIFLREEKTAPNHAGSAISKPLVFHERKYQLGNVVSPVHADFELKNLAAPVTISTTTTRYLGGNAQGSSVVRTGLGERGEKIFDGFQSNPADYDNDVTVKIAYSAKDRFGVTVQGEFVLHGRSILSTLIVHQTFVPDPSKIARAAVLAQRLIELGIVSRKPNLPKSAGGPNPTLQSGGKGLGKDIGASGTTAEIAKLGRTVRQRDEGLPSPSKTRLSDDKVKRAIDRRVQATLTAKTFLDAVADVHQELSAEEVPIESWPPALENSGQGGRLAVVEEALEAEQRNFEAVLAHAIAAQVLDGLQKEPEFEKLFGTL